MIRPPLLLELLIDLWHVCWDWCVDKDTRTWVVHGLISLGASAGAGAVGINIRGSGEGPLFFALAATLMLMAYLAKEIADKWKHRKVWNVPRGREGVRPAVDMAGDLMGPLFVALTAWTLYLFFRTTV